jgi:hypothetical protein
MAPDLTPPFEQERFMRREFYTEKDIEDLCKSGTMSLEMHDRVVLTGLAHEKARALGITLVRNSPDHPPGAPVRPYLSQDRGRATAPRAEVPAVPVRTRTGDSPGVTSAAPVEVDLPGRIRQAVVARLGAQVDDKLLDVIIQRVLASTGVK